MLRRWKRVRQRLLAVALLCPVYACDREAGAWDRARSENTRASYATFLSAHGAGRFAAEARDSLRSVSWRNAQTSGTQSAYREFLSEFGEGPFSDSARAMGQDFRVRIVGRGQIDLPNDRGSRRAGPVIELSPQWQLREARLSGTTSYATSKGGERIPMLFFVPIDAGGHSAETSAPEGAVGKQAVLQTWIPAVNTFTRRFNAIGVRPDQTDLVLRFTAATTAMRFGIVYEADYAEIATIELLGHSLRLPP